MNKTKLWSKNYIFIILINFLVFTNHIMLLSTFPFYVEKLGKSTTVAGTAALLFSLVAVLCRPFVGWMLDNGKRKSILLLGLLGMGLMPLGYYFSSVLLILLLFRMIHGASLACSSTANATIASDTIPPSRFAEGMGYFGMATALATACAPSLGLFLMNRLGFTALFFTAASLIICAFFLLLFLQETPMKKEKKPLLLSSLFSKDALPASGVTVIFMITFGALENFLSKYASENGLPSGGLYFLIMSILLLFTRLTVGKIADQRGEDIFVYTCNASMLLSFLLLAFIPNQITFFLSAVLSGYAFGGLEPALQSMAVHTAPPEQRGSANSTFLCAYDIGIGIGGGLSGLLITHLGYSHMWAILALANIGSVLLYQLFGKHHPSSLKY